MSAHQAPMTLDEKRSLFAAGALVLVGGYYSPIDNRTVTTVAITSGLAGGFGDWGRYRIEHNYDNLTPYQRVIAWTLLGAAVGVGIDTLLRPKISPERI